jgi:predicted dehydrogenase
VRPLIPSSLQDVPLYGDLDTLLAQERPEAVLIALANDVTPEAIVRAAESGAHVYAEKPCARTAGEFLPALEAMRKAGVQFATGYLRRSSPVGQAIKDMVDEGLLGRLVSIEARWITTSVTVRDPAHYYFSRERSGGGILHWLGCHWLDLMRWVSSAEVVEVAAILDTLSGEAIGVEDAVALVLRYSNGWTQPGGMVGSLHCAYVTDRATDQLFFGLRGTLGWVEWQKSGPDLVAHSAHPAWATAPTRVLRFEPEPVGGYGGAQGISTLRRFIASFREGVCPAFVAEDALRILEVLDAAHASAASGRRVSPRR